MARTPASRTHKLRTPLPPGDFYPFRPRSYQRKLLQAFSIDLATKRPRTRHGVCVWHRRSGKDATAMLGVALPAIALRPGNYFHIFPYFSQARRAIWQEEASFLDRIPPHWDPKRIGTEMFVELTIPGSGKKARYFLLGADDTATVSKLVGSNPLGVIYSEAAQIDPSVRNLLLPVLAENGGWELFISTPRGKNWFYELYRKVLNDKDWFCEVLTVDHTVRDAKAEDGSPLVHPDGRVEDGTPVITQEKIAEHRRSGMTEEEIQQEYYASWEGYAVGTVYGDLIQQARKDGRIGRCPHDPAKAVGVMLDLGRADMLAMWFYQVHGSEIRFVDYHAARGMDTDSCIAYLLKLPYVYARIILPHDAAHETFNAPDSVLVKFRKRFRAEIAVAPKTPKHLQVNAVRTKFARFVFDEAKCGRELDRNLPSGLDALGNYRRKWDEEKKAFSTEPVHDQFSHGADALATGFCGWREGLETLEREWERQTVALTDFNPMDYEVQQEEVYAAR